MPDSRSLAIFLAAGLALNFTPGPDMMYVAARAANDGRRAGVASAFGIGGGILVHIAVVALGLATLLATVPLAYTVVRIAGASYLIYLGVQALRSGKGSTKILTRSVDLSTVFWQGFLTNVLNPKVALFFLAFLPQFVDPLRGNPTHQVVVLGLLFDTTGTVVNLGVAIGSSGVGARLKTGRVGDGVRKFTGAVLIMLGLRLALSSRN